MKRFCKFMLIFIRFSYFYSYGSGQWAQGSAFEHSSARDRHRGAGIAIEYHRRGRMVSPAQFKVRVWIVCGPQRALRERVLRQRPEPFARPAPPRRRNAVCETGRLVWYCRRRSRLHQNLQCPVPRHWMWTGTPSRRPRRTAATKLLLWPWKTGTNAWAGCRTG